MTLKLFTVRPLSDLPPPDTFPSKFMQINCSAQADKHPATRQLGLRVRGMTELCISDSNFELMEPQDRKWNSCKILPWAGLGWAVITSATCKNSSRMAAGTSTGRAIRLLAGWRGRAAVLVDTARVGHHHPLNCSIQIYLYFVIFQ